MSLTARPISSPTISRWRSSTPLDRRAVELDDQILGAQAGAVGGAALDDLDDLDAAAPPERAREPRRQRPRAAGDPDVGAPEAALAHQRADDPARGRVDRHGEAEPDARRRRC